jgi:hypothetical protein
MEVKADVIKPLAYDLVLVVELVSVVHQQHGRPLYELAFRDPPVPFLGERVFDVLLGY